MSDDKKKGGTNEQSLNDYLQAPRRKRRNYVFLATEQDFDKDVEGAIINFIKRQYPQLAITTPRTPVEFLRQLGRVISLVVISDEFDENGQTMRLIQQLKEKKNHEAVPVIFLTRNAKKLVEQYHQQLLAFHELDEYIQFPSLPIPKILARVKAGIDTRNQRRSRRYKINLPVNIYHLNQDRHLRGEILDFSVHGALIKAKEEILFRELEQLRLSIPVTGLMPPTSGDFLKVSAKIRRVYISGDMAGVSFEYVSEKQLIDLTKFVSIIVNRELQRKSNRLRAQIAATNTKVEK